MRERVERGRVAKRGLAALVLLAFASCRATNDARELGERAGRLGPADAHPVAREALTPEPLVLAPLPGERHGHRAEVLSDGRLLVFGGYDRVDTSDTRGAHESWLFEPELSAWRRTGDLAVPLTFHASVVDEGVVYAIGAECLQRFDAASETWSIVLRDERLPSTHAGAAVVGGVLFAVGFESVVVDLATLTLTALPTPPEHHDQDHFSYVVALAGRLHLIGGFAGHDFQPRTRHVVFDGERWSHAAPLPFADAAKFGVGVVHADRFVLVGMGGNAVYDVRTDTWESLPPAPWSDFRCMAAACVHGEHLHVLGGLGEHGIHGHDVFDLARRAWSASEWAPRTTADRR